MRQQVQCDPAGSTFRGARGCAARCHSPWADRSTLRAALHWAACLPLAVTFRCIRCGAFCVLSLLTGRVQCEPTASFPVLILGLLVRDGLPSLVRDSCVARRCVTLAGVCIAARVPCAAARVLWLSQRGCGTTGWSGGPLVCLVHKWCGAMRAREGRVCVRTERPHALPLAPERCRCRPSPSCHAAAAPMPLRYPARRLLRLTAW